jgi:hypothetical protein
MGIDRRDVQAYLSAERERLAREYGVRRIAIFGSVARGETKSASDLDILVEMDNPTFDRYMDLKFELEDRFGVPVDVVLADALKERLKPIIEREAIYV